MTLYLLPYCAFTRIFLLLILPWSSQQFLKLRLKTTSDHNHNLAIIDTGHFTGLT